MNYKKILLIILVVSVLLFVIGFLFADPISIGLCSAEDYSCDTKIGDTLGVPLLLFSPALLLIAIILLFTREEIFRSWSKFAKIFLPIAAILIILSPSQPSFLNPDKELTTWWMAGLFLVISIFLIAWKWWRTRSPNAALK